MTPTRPHAAPQLRRDELVDLSSHPNLFHGIALVCIFGSAAIGLMQWYAGVPVGRLFALGMVFCMGVAGEILVAIKKHRTAYVTLIWGIWCAVTVQALGRGGLSNPGLYVYPVVILMSGFLIGARHALATLVASCVALLFMAVGIELEAFAPAAALTGPIQGLTMAGILVLCYTALRLFLNNHWSDLRAIQKLNEQLEETVGSLTQSEGNYRLLNEELEQRVEARTADLSATLSELERTKEELIHAGKLQALGSLVAGVAHELNTPIGNALVAASTLGDGAREVQRASAGNQLKRSQLEGFLETVAVGADLVQRSLFRASDLVRNFKQVAVDQASERRRVFELNVAVEEVISTLKPNFKTAAWTLQVEIPENIRVDSFPGALGQIIINLVVNASIHAFEADQTGTVRIGATQMPDDCIELTCSDDGKGIAPEALPRIFEPFFTTRLGQGGSGLGLAITHSIASKVLGGTFSVESEIGKGTLFSLKFPRVAPDLS